MDPKTTHPLYATFLTSWEMMNDCYRGEAAVKERGTLYLPATPGQILDGMESTQVGYQNYLGYRKRARFPDFISQAVEALLGVMHRKPAVITVPKVMEPMIEKATIRGESMQMLLRRINTGQLVTGRIGILADIPDGATPDVLPYVSTYAAPAILNWDDGGGDVLNLVCLDETEYKRIDQFSWDRVTSTRVCLLDATTGNYATGVFTGEYDPKGMVTPSRAGNVLQKIPFVVINSKDIVSDPDDPPLLGLARLALAVYRAEADYRQALFMQGQDTLVVVGGDGTTVRVGAGARIDVPLGGDAKYIGVSGAGIPEMRMALENDNKTAGEIGGQLMNTNREAESGDALRIRVSARTASLNQIALTGAEGLKSLLRTIAAWVGANPDEVEVTPNLDFAEDTMDGQTLVSFMTAKGLGAPISKRTIHDRMREQEITSMTYEEELDEIAQEEPEPTGGGDDTDDDQQGREDETADEE